MDLIFDIDGTLWDTTEVVAKAWTKAVFETKIDGFEQYVITADMLKKEFGKPMDVIADDLMGDINPVAKASLLKKCCVYEHKAIEENDEDLAYVGMRETMHTLAERNSLYIVSNCQDGYIELVMEKNGLTPLIKDYECFGHNGLSKGQNILEIVKRNNLKNPVYIGDTYGDYSSAKEAGVKFVFASYGFGTVPEYDGKIDSFSQLTSLF